MSPEQFLVSPNGRFRLELQGDGNLVIKDHGVVAWIAESSHTRDKSVWYNSYLALQDDGNMVIYDNRTGALCWARFGFVPGRSVPKIYKILFQSKEHPIWRFDFW
jgi:hypothetical protein